MTTQLEPHPLAMLFPPMEGKELDELVKDISENGQREPITLYEGKVLDGRNRYAACQKLGIKPLTKEYEDDHPKEYVISMNIRRRHLTAEQKRALIAELLNENPAASDRQIASRVGVDHKTVADVRGELVARGEIPHAATRTDTRGRQQSATKKNKGNTKQIVQQATPKLTRPDAVLEKVKDWDTQRLEQLVEMINNHIKDRASANAPAEPVAA